MLGLAISGVICFTMFSIYSMCVVAGEADRQMEQDLIQMKRDREREQSERDHE